MKKVIFALMAFCAITFSSCSTDETSTPEQAIQKTNVGFAVASSDVSTTSKQIKRNVSIPPWVKTIRITATSTSPAYSVFDDYQFETGSGGDFITLDNVAVGLNTFTAVTTTDSPQFFQLTNFTTNAGDFDDKFKAALNNINKDNPYAIYNAVVNSITIAFSGTNLVNLPLTTQHGRILSVFQVTEQLKTLGLQAKITASAPGEATQTAITKSNEIVTFKWSNANAVKDKEVTYKVEVSSINNQSVILKTYEVKQKVIASTSLSCAYTIDSSGISLKRNDIKITLNFQEWVEANCDDCN